ncbi:hypothetical protein C0991_010690, partial [Blastosporella zonata]
DVPRAAKTHDAAFKNDPLIKYAKNRKCEPSFAVRMIERAQISVYLVTCIRTSTIALTIDSGKANVTIIPPKECSEEPKEDTIVKLVRWTQAALRLWLNHLDPDSEAVKRSNEAKERLLSQEALKRMLGDRVDEMWYVDGIFTDPASQGHGYGGALLDAATTMVTVPVIET